MASAGSWADDVEHASTSPTAAGLRPCAFPPIHHDPEPTDPNPALLVLSHHIGRDFPAPAAVWLPDEPFVSPFVSDSGNRLFVCRSAGLPAGTVVASALFRWVGRSPVAGAGSWATEPGRMPWVRDSRWPLDYFAPLDSVCRSAAEYHHFRPGPTAALTSLWAVDPKCPMVAPEPRMCVRLLEALAFGEEITVDIGLAACLVPHLNFFEQAGDCRAAETIRSILDSL